MKKDPRKEFIQKEQERRFKLAFPDENSRIAYLVERLKRTKTYRNK